MEYKFSSIDSTLKLFLNIEINFFSSNKLIVNVIVFIVYMHSLSSIIFIGIWVDFYFFHHFFIDAIVITYEIAGKIKFESGDSPFK